MKLRALAALPLLLSLAPLAVPPAVSDAPPLAASSDFVWAHFSAPHSRIVIVSPEGDEMTVEYAPNLPSTVDAVAKINFAGIIVSARRDTTNDPVPTTAFAVISDLVGTRVDGTWSIIQANGDAESQQYRPSGIQLSVQGKVWDDVMALQNGAPAGPTDTGLTVFGANMASEPIEAGGSGRYASDLSSTVKMWNWHEQKTARYDVGVIAATNDINPEQNPRLWKFRHGASTYTPLSYSTGSADRFWAHLAPYSSARVVAPDGQELVVRYMPTSDAANCLGSPRPGDCVAPAVVETTLDGSILSARLAFAPFSPLPTSRFEVVGSIIRAPVDGTWTVDTARNTAGLAAGMRMVVGGKVYDNVADDLEPIEGTGTASYAGGAAPYSRLWNWHVQDVLRYDTHATSANTPVETPSKIKLFGYQAGTVPNTPGAPRVETLDASGGWRHYTTTDGAVTVYIDRDQDGTFDSDEIGATTPPVGDIVASPQQIILNAVPNSQLQPMSHQQGGTTQTYVFRVNYVGVVPARQVTLWVDGSYYGLTDVSDYPVGHGGMDAHRMFPLDTNPIDGTVYQVSVQLKPGAHTYYFSASDTLSRWYGTSLQTGPTVI